MVFTVKCATCGFVSFEKAPDARELERQLAARTHCYGGHNHEASHSSYKVVGCEPSKPASES
jgi:hypothetical protein